MRAARQSRPPFLLSFSLHLHRVTTNAKTTETPSTRCEIARGANCHSYISIFPTVGPRPNSAHRRGRGLHEAAPEGASARMARQRSDLPRLAREGARGCRK